MLNEVHLPYELWFTDGPEVAVVVAGDAMRRTAGYVLPLPQGGWATRVNGDARTVVHPDGYAAAEYVYQAYSGAKEAHHP